MTQKIILTKGLPGSGKSTWAREQQLLEPGRYKIVNRDSLRAMLDSGVYTPKNEQFIRDARDQLILLALRNGYDVIVDDTNMVKVSEAIMRGQVGSRIVAGMVDLEIKDFTDVPLEICIQRDSQRPKPVGEQVIRDMWQRYKQEGAKEQ